MVQGLRLCASTAEGMVSIPGQGTKDATLFMAVAKNKQKKKAKVLTSNEL